MRCPHLVSHSNFASIHKTAHPYRSLTEPHSLQFVGLLAEQEVFAIPGRQEAAAGQQVSTHIALNKLCWQAKQLR